ncbi:unnamed protein product [Cylindrotheca closterium]|uniref:NTF2 domain-containing protein n=1 Tax=Cylindrotheca closterium TaxID=2856 RepID=A0AAD2CIS5_9STRA|nr:unnamed protein product [Cylindrotheca closterium]
MQPATPVATDGSVGSGAGPTPQMIGIRFVKTYYQVLSTTPAQIFKFYKPSSVLSHGEGSTPTSAVDFEKYDLNVRWGEAQRFDFDNGAIDAQPSADGSILLVVTGHVLVKAGDGKEERKGFVHTFFLALVSLPNKQKTYYVKNDILRFLKSDVPSVVDAAPADPTPELAAVAAAAAAAVTPELVAKEEAAPVEVPAVVEEEPAKEEKKEDVPAEVVEVPKEEPKVEKEPAPVEDKPKEAKEQPKETSAAEPKKKEKGKRQRGRGKSPQNAAKQQPASKPTPGSWASLVASGSGPTATPAQQASSTPAKAPVSEKTETPAKSNAPTETVEKTDAASTKENGKNSNKDKPKRDPDNTLVIKNLPDGTKEAELLAIFEQFAVQTNAKIVSSTISSHRGLAFVDYDSVAPVMAAVEQHGKEPIQLNGKVLEVDQKTAEQRARKARGGYRSGSPNNNSNNNNSNNNQNNNNNRGGGRQNKRNNGGRGGKGNRGGGGNGGNNSGGNNNNKDGGGGQQR